MFFQFPLVIGFQFGLGRRQERAYRIVNQVQRKISIDAITERIQELQRLDAPFEDAFAALRINIIRRVTRHRRDNLDSVPGQKIGEIFVAGLEQNGEIATIDDMA